jgi:hypothetical protein
MTHRVLAVDDRVPFRTAAMLRADGLDMVACR